MAVDPANAQNEAIYLGWRCLDESDLDTDLCPFHAEMRRRGITP
jgi:hypothetical protein